MVKETKKKESSIEVVQNHLGPNPNPVVFERNGIVIGGITKIDLGDTHVVRIYGFSGHEGPITVNEDFHQFTATFDPNEMERFLEPIKNEIDWFSVDLSFSGTLIGGNAFTIQYVRGNDSIYVEADGGYGHVKIHRVELDPSIGKFSPHLPNSIIIDGEFTADTLEGKVIATPEDLAKTLLFCRVEMTYQMPGETGRHSSEDIPFTSVNQMHVFLKEVAKDRGRFWHSQDESIPARGLLNVVEALIASYN